MTAFISVGGVVLQRGATQKRFAALCEKHAELEAEIREREAFYRTQGPQLVAALRARRARETHFPQPGLASPDELLPFFSFLSLFFQKDSLE